MNHTRTLFYPNRIQRIIFIRRAAAATIPTRCTINRSHGCYLNDNNSTSQHWPQRRNFSSTQSRTSATSTASSISNDNEEELTSTDTDIDDDKVNISNDFTSPSFLRDHYTNLTKTSPEWSLDEHQLEALTELDRLRSELLSSPFRHDDGDDGDVVKESNQFGGFLQNLFSSRDGGGTGMMGVVPKGVYLHGGVGCGKTMCMDMFYDSLSEDESKQKVHFHKFMLGVHKQMHEAKMVEGIEGDVLPRVIERTIQRGKIICFDEFQVTDVADALILRRLFTGLMEQGAVVVATSNRTPRDLYLNGLQRDRFIPFIDMLEEKLNVISMWDSVTDYRLIQGAIKARGVYFIGPDVKPKFEDTFHELTKDLRLTPTSLTTQGRRVDVPIASIQKGIARFKFDDLCRKALGAADYLVIGENFHTVFVEGVPKLGMNEINHVRRFITFVDSMYEMHVKLIIHAATKPEGIFEVDLQNQAFDEVFSFDRTRSRLEEMGSEQYLKRRWSGGTEKKGGRSQRK